MSKPVIVQSDNTLLLEVANPDFEKARDSISPFAELEKSPEHIHTYRISPLSLWNAAASGLTDRDIIETLLRYSRYDIPEIVLRTIRDQMQRYGMLKLEKEGEDLILTSKDPILLNEILNHRKVQTYIDERMDSNRARVIKNFRGHIKQALIKIGFPVEDLAGYEEGEPCPINLRDISLRGQSSG
jgi:DNA excision repair protein ERCC-3